MQDPLKKYLWVANKTLCLMEEGRGLGTAYDMAFSDINSGLYSYEYHEARVAVKILLRDWKNKKRKQQTLRLAGFQKMAREAKEDICPLV